MYEELIQRLHNAAGGLDGIKMCHDAADAIERLEAENATLRAKVQERTNDPLSLDELRQMDGEPVWHTDGGSGYICLLIDGVFEGLRDSDGSIFCSFREAAGCVYRRKPDKEGRDV